MNNNPHWVFAKCYGPQVGDPAEPFVPPGVVKEITFITLRRRSPRVLQDIHGLPPSAWRRIELDVPTRQYRTPRVYEQSVTLAGCPLRQVYVTDLGHEEPTVLLTNDRRRPIPQILTRYAQRMLVESAISDAVRFFHMDALSSAVGLKVRSD